MNEFIINPGDGCVKIFEVPEGKKHSCIVYLQLDFLNPEEFDLIEESVYQLLGMQIGELVKPNPPIDFLWSMSLGEEDKKNAPSSFILYKTVTTTGMSFIKENIILGEGEGVYVHIHCVKPVKMVVKHLNVISE